MAPTLPEDAVLDVQALLDQLRFGVSTEVRAHAAAALGPTLKAARGSAPSKLALELGVFDVLHDVLADSSCPPRLAEGAHVALAGLLTPSGSVEETSAAWPYLRKAANMLLQEPFLAALAAQLRVAPPGSRSVEAISRLVAGLCPHVHDPHEVALLDSGLVETLIARVSPSASGLTDAAQCASAALALARATPGLFMCMVAPPQPSPEDAHVAHEVGPAWRCSGDGEPPAATKPIPADPCSSLFRALCELYCATIRPTPSAAPSPDPTQAFGQQTSAGGGGGGGTDGGDVVAPGDAARLFLRALALDPWARPDASMPKPLGQRMLLNGVLGSQALGCLLSYLVVDAGGVKHALAGAAAHAAAALRAAADGGAAAAAQSRQKLRVLKDQLRESKALLAEARDLGRLEEPRSLELAELARDTAAQGRALQAEVLALEAQAAVGRDAGDALDAWVRAHQRPAGKVRRATPHLAVLRQVMDEVQRLAGGDGAAAAAGPKQLDWPTAGLRHTVQAGLLAGGLVPTLVKLHGSAQASLQLCARLWVLVGPQLGAPRHLAARCREVLASVRMCEGAVRKVATRLRLASKQAEDKAQRATRRLASHTLGVTLKGKDVELVKQETLDLAWELVQLSHCEAQLQSLEEDLQHARLTQAALDYLEQSADAAQTVIKPLAASLAIHGGSPPASARPTSDTLPDAPSPDRSARPRSPHDSNHAAGARNGGAPTLHDAALAASLPDGPVSAALLDQLAPLLAAQLGSLSADSTPLLVDSLDRVLHPLSSTSSTPMATTRGSADETAHKQRPHSAGAGRRPASAGAHGRRPPVGSVATLLAGADGAAAAAAEVRQLALLELQVHSLGSTLRRAEQLLPGGGPGSFRAAARGAWAVFNCQLLAAHLARVMPGGMRALVPDPGQVRVLTHPEYHSVHALLEQPPDKLRAALPQLCLNYLLIQQQWQAMGVQGGQAVGGLVAAADGDRSFVDEGLVVPELLEALQGRGGDRLAALALATTTPGLGGTAGARPHSARAGSLSGGRAAAPRKDGLDSNFRNVVFTMSPMKGAPPRGLLDGAAPVPELPGLSDADLERLPLQDQCEAVIRTARDALLLVLDPQAGLAAGGGPQWREDLAEEEQEEVEEQEGDVEAGARCWRHRVVHQWQRQRLRQYQAMQRLASQVAGVSGTLEGLAQLAMHMRAVRRRACLLACHADVGWDVVPPHELRRWLPQLMHVLAHGLSRPSDRLPILDVVRQAARQAATLDPPPDYHATYVATGVVRAVARLLAAPTGKGALAEDAAGVPSRYSVDPSVVARPSAASARVQAAAAQAVLAIHHAHPDVLLELVPTSEGRDEEEEERAPNLLPDLVSLATDHSLPQDLRLCGAQLLAKLLSAPTADGASSSDRAVLAGAQEARELAIKAGAFGALLDVMDGDHRHPDPHGAKAAAVDALVAVAASDEARDAVVSATEAAHEGAAALGGQASSASLHARSGHGAGKGAGGKKPAAAGGAAAAAAAALRAVAVFPTVRTSDDVLRRVLLALWAPTRQLHSLMSSDRTKRGKYVDPATVAPLTGLSLYTAKALCALADEEPLARRVLQAMGIGARINLPFLQSIKDSALHEALLELRDKVPVRTADDDDR